MLVPESIGIPAAFIAGLLSFLSPCVLPLTPAYLSYISGTSVEDLAAAPTARTRGATALRAALFVLGFTIVFVAMGATATALGQTLVTRTPLLMRVAGVVIILFGLHTLGALRIPALYREHRVRLAIAGASAAGAVAMGAVFALGWTPCIGPVLMGILTLAADAHTVSRGMILLASYSLGLGIPFIAAGLAAAMALSVIPRIRQHFRTVEIASGALLLAMGLAVLTGNLQRIATMIEHAVTRLM